MSDIICNDIFSQWKATRTARDRAMPHIKSYTRFSPDWKQIPWFVLTSANLSKAAWGTVRKDSHYILNYEAGVIFIPQLIVRKGNVIPIYVFLRTNVPSKCHEFYRMDRPRFPSKKTKQAFQSFPFHTTYL